MSDQDTPMYVLEASTPLSQSMVWRLQRTFYGDQGIEAWSRSNVPQGITTSPNIARAYARIVHGYFQDIQHSLDPTQPVYIVELGAGSGRFAYRFLKALTLQQTPKFVYIMTDAILSVMDFWRDNPRLKPFVDAGVLDFAQFDLLDLAPLTLLNSKVILRPGGVANPVVMIGNYIFDTIPQDAYTIRSGQLFANLVSISASTPELDLTTPDSRVRISITFGAAETPHDPAAESDPLVGALLNAYAERLDNTTVMVPRAAMACLRFFRDLAGERALCVIGDFGDTSEDELPEHGPPGFGAGGGLWLSVNFHALGEYTRTLGGQVRHPANRHIRLNVSAFLFGPAPFDHADQAFADTIDLHGPDDLAMVARSVAEGMPNLSFDVILALLRTTGWDTDYLMRSVPRLIEVLPTAEDRLRHEVPLGIQLAWDQYYPIGEQDDVPFGLGALLYTLERYAEALEFFEISLRDFGEDPRTTINLALTHYRLGHLSESLQWIDRTLALDPDHEMALNMRPDILAALELPPNP